jgi:hypothetical protein
LDESVPGTLSNSHPTSATAAVIVVAIVTNVHQTQGTIQIITPQAFTLGNDFDGMLRQSIVNKNPGTSAASAFTTINDANRRASFGIIGSNHATLPANGAFLYNEGYGQTGYVNDGNVDHVWFTDPGDTHNYSYVEKMRLTAAGDLKLPNDNAKLYLGSGSDYSIEYSGSEFRHEVGGSRYFHNVGTDNVFIGEDAGNYTASSAERNVALGKEALKSVTSGRANIGIGPYALENLTSGLLNIGIGQSALTSVTEANSTIAIGGSALESLTTGVRNLAFGNNTLTDVTTAGDNVAVGNNAGQYIEGQQNVAIGTNALLGANTNANFMRNVAIGQSAGAGSRDGANNNIYIGFAAGLSANATENVVIGSFAGNDLTTGDSNVIIGYSAADGQLTTESDKLWIANSNTATPLIYGEFDNDLLKINGRVGTPSSIVTLGVGATTFAITSNVHTITGDGGGNTVATITGGVDGQILTLIFVDANVTITDDNTHGADSIDLSGAFTSADDTVLQLVYDGTSWYEISRSVN